eukprot:971398-Alexandrium_andersonii.AAC.1
MCHARAGNLGRPCQVGALLSWHHGGRDGPGNDGSGHISSLPRGRGSGHNGGADVNQVVPHAAS